MRWVLEGVYSSAQVDRTATVVALAGALISATVAMTLFALTGPDGLAQDIFPFLSQIQVGNGKLLLLAAVGYAGAFSMEIAMARTFLKDTEWLPPLERTSRKIGRKTARIASILSSVIVLGVLFTQAYRLLKTNLVERLTNEDLVSFMIVTIFTSIIFPPLCTVISGMLAYKFYRRRNIPKSSEEAIAENQD